MGALATHDLTTLFVWDRLGRGLVGALGAYVLLRQWTDHWAIRLMLPPLLVWSSFLLAVFHQTAIIDQFISAPWAAYFALRIVHIGDVRWRNWLGMALSIGTAWQSYYFAGLWIFLFFLGVGVLLFRREDLGLVRAEPGVWRKAAVSVVLTAVMALPNAVVFAERASWVFPARMLDHSYVGRPPAGGPLQYEPASSVRGAGSVFLPYPVTQYTGTFSSPWDFLQMLTPEGSRHARGNEAPLVFGHPSEAFLYMGLLGYAVALWGLAVGQHPLKRVWLVSTLGFGLLMLGPSGGLHWLLRVYPPLWMVRHTHVFASFFILGMLYFFVLGGNHLARWALRRIPRGEAIPPGPRWWLEVLGCSAALYLAAVTFVHITATPRLLPSANWEAALVAAPLVALILMRKRLSGLGIVAAILLAHVVLVLYYGPTRQVLGHLVTFLAVPGLLILLTVSGRFANHRRWAVLIAGAFLLADLGLYVTRSQWLWHWSRPDHVLRISPRPVRPEPPAPRTAVLASEYLYDAYPQPIRYLSLPLRRPVAFSSVMYTAVEPEAFFRSAPLAIPETVWPGGDPPRTCPVGAEVKLVIPVAPSLRNHRLWVHLLVKSDNTAHDGVQVEADFGARRIVRHYRNSRDWERMTLDGPLEADQIVVIARVRAIADAPALVTELAVRANPTSGPPLDFDPALVRAAPRWNSFIVPAPYFALVHADLPIERLSDMLALGSAPVQFRAQLANPAARAGTISVKRYDYNSLRLTVNAPTAGYVYVADGFARGWRARVDGRPSPVLRANMAFKAVGVGAGNHEIRLEYRPMAFQFALWAYASAVALGSGALVIVWFRQRN